MAHRIDGPDNVAGMFSDNGPGAATVVTDDWMNDVQENLCQFIEAAGITLVKGTYTQLTAAVAAYIATHNAVTNPHSATALATASRLVLRDAAGRAAVADPSAAGDIATKGYVDSARNDAGITGNGTWTITEGRLVKQPNGLVFVSFKATAGATPPVTIASLPVGYRPISEGMGLSAINTTAGTGTLVKALTTGGVLGLAGMNVTAGDVVIISGTVMTS